MRSIERKRPPLMNTRRWIIFFATLLVMILVLLVLVFREAQMPMWQGEAKAIQQVREQALLAQPTKATRHVWNEAVWVVEGNNAEGDPAYVWLFTDDSEAQPIIHAAKDGVSKEQIEALLQKDKSGAEVIHLQLGMLDRQPVWEVYFSIEGKPTRYFYRFYRFADGALIENYQLPSVQVS